MSFYDMINWQYKLRHLHLISKNFSRLLGIFQLLERNYEDFTWNKSKENFILRIYEEGIDVLSIYTLYMGCEIEDFEIMYLKFFVPML